MPGKCAFRDDWLTKDKDIAKWLRPVQDDKYRAFCLFCNSKFDISYSGYASLKTHMKGKKHQDLACAVLQGKQTTLKFQQSLSPSVAIQPPSQEISDPLYVCVAVPSTSKSSLDSFVLNEDIIKAEILWALNKVMCHSSDRSSCKSSDLFSVMFPDSIIAQKFKMQKDKLGYIVSYGLGPYFQDKLCMELNKCDYYCVSIDESLNKISQKGQMDIIVRYWDASVNQVATHYLTSTFLGHSTAVDLLNAFIQALSELSLPLTKIMQICTDGPNVNIKFLNDFQCLMKAEFQNSEDAQLIDVGTCCLHIIHGAYKTAHDKSKWSLNKFLRSLYFLFKDFPSRRADYTFHSGSTLFPLKMCSIRWIENSRVIERAIKILPFVKVYVEAMKSKPPASNNFHVVQQFLTDELLPAKLAFLQSIALELEPFLQRFQTDKPLLPFLYTECYSMMRSIAERFVKKEVMDVVKNAHQLVALDVLKTEKQLHIRKVDIGFGAVRACKGLKESSILSFRADCKNFLISLHVKLLSKSPLYSKMVKGASCLSPSIMLSSDAFKSNRISVALEEFISKKYINVTEADLIKKTYMSICQDQNVKETLKSFDWNAHRLDVFIMETLSGVCCNRSGIDMVKFLGFCTKIFCMFHGNAAIERGFSVNKECLIDNLHEQSLIAQRCIYSAVSSSGGLLDVDITKPMIMSVRRASSKRKEAVEEKKRKNTEKSNEAKCAKEKVKELKQKKIKLMQLADEEAHAIDLEIAEAKKQMVHLI